jgi:NADH dehydrogenase
MLAEVASSGLEAQHISAPVRAALPRTRFRRAEVADVDVAAATVGLRTGRAAVERLPYDHLVLALGAVPNFFGLPGMETHAFTLKTLQDATRLRNHVITQLERADAEIDPVERRRALSFVVAGGGFAGTEMIAELFDLVHSVLRYYPGIRPDEPRFALVHSGERILPEISPALADYALRKLQARGIEFVLKTRVAGATDAAVLLGEGHEIPARTVVWTAGNQPHPLLKTLPCERNRAGAVLAAPTLEVQGLSRVWAAGDCAEIPDLNSPGRSCPPTAQHALRQGRVAAENIAAAINGRRPAPFRFRALGVLVALGHRTAVAEIRGLKFSGFLAWFMWRTVYLSKLPGLEKKVRVALDWALDLFFPRDIVLTGGAGTPTLTQMTGAAAQSGAREP